MLVTHLLLSVADHFSPCGIHCTHIYAHVISKLSVLICVLKLDTVITVSLLSKSPGSLLVLAHCSFCVITGYYDSTTVASVPCLISYQDRSHDSLGPLPLHEYHCFCCCSRLKSVWGGQLLIMGLNSRFATC